MLATWVRTPALLLGFYLAAFSAAASSAEYSSRLTLGAYLDNEYAGWEFSLALDDREVCRYVHVPLTVGMSWPPGSECRFEVPPAAETLHLRALKPGLIFDTRHEQSFRLVDTSAETPGLYDRSTPFGERMRVLFETAKAWEDSAVELSGKRMDADARAQIEARLGHPLPAALAEFCSTVGGVEFDGFGHWLNCGDELQPLKQQMYRFGSDYDNSPEWQAVFDRAVFVALEGGDGIGYFAYLPAPNAECPGEAWFRFHQDGSDFTWLKDADGRCPDSEAALLTLFENLLIDAREVAETSAPGAMRIDRSRPHHYLALRRPWHADSKQPFRLEVESRW